MNCEALSLSGERVGIFSKLYLLLQTLNESTQEYDTSLEDVYGLFILASNLLQAFDEGSSNPAGCVAITAYITAQLAGYRRVVDLIPMADRVHLLEVALAAWPWACVLCNRTQVEPTPAWIANPWPVLTKHCSRHMLCWLDLEGADQAVVKKR